MRLCNKCLEIKPLVSFTLTKGNYRRTCNICSRNIAKGYVSNINLDRYEIQYLEKCILNKLSFDQRVFSKSNKEKFCSTCYQVKPLENFRERKGKQKNKFYRVCICKSCEISSQREYETNNVEKLQLLKNKWKNEGRPYKNRVKWSSKSPEKYLLSRARSNARNRKLDFNLELEDIIIPEKCPYLNIPISVELSRKWTPNAASVDRIDSTKGYIKGNIQIISNKANSCKSNLTIEQLKEFAKNILILHSE